MTSTAHARRALHSSESEEWYTPREYVEAARTVMGGIELDPASCVEANATVRARRIFTESDDGLRKPWEARSVWLNPPYGKSEDDNRSNQAVWLHRLIGAYNAGAVEEACILVNAVPGNKWFEPLWQHAICFVRGRIHFVAPAGSGPRNSPTHSSVVAHLGRDHARFAEVFGLLGHVVTPDRVVAARAQRSLL